MMMNLDDKIEGWFKKQRTAVGKLYKKKSDQAAGNLTPRSQWQLKNSTLLKQRIVPWSHTQKTDLVDTSILIVLYLFQCNNLTLKNDSIVFHYQLYTGKKTVLLRKRILLISLPCKVLDSGDEQETFLEEVQRTILYQYNQSPPDLRCPPSVVQK